MNEPLLKPPLLRAGDRIRIVAPSGPVDAALFHQGVDCLSAMGFEPCFGEDVFSREAYFAGPDQRRRQEFQAALADSSARAVWFARGGYGATRILPGISKAQILAQRQWLVGFSDASAMHSLWQQAGLQSLHASNITGLSGWSDEARARLFQWLMRGEMAPLRGQSVTGHGSGIVEGTLMGGNVTVLATLAGTGFLPVMRGALVFLEDVGERPYRLDRNLVQLCQSGVFDGAAGFIIGQLTDCDDDDPRNGRSHGRGALEAVLSVLEPLGVPILTGLSVGHERSSLPLPLGARAVLDTAAQSLSII